LRLAILQCKTMKARLLMECQGGSKAVARYDAAGRETRVAGGGGLGVVRGHGPPPRGGGRRRNEGGRTGRKERRREGEKERRKDAEDGKGNVRFEMHQEPGVGRCHV
jgi:hypothetical protein